MDASTESVDRLLRDLQHRVKNIAAVIRSIARKTADTSTDLESFQERFDGRLGALVRAHAAMSRTTDRGVDLEELVHDALLENSAGSANWSVEGPAVRLEAPLIETLALIFHELAAEAANGGAFDVPGPDLSVRWSVDHAARRLHLEWRETGLAQRSSPEEFAFAEELLRSALPYQFNGAAEWGVGADGLWCILDLPTRAGVAP